MRKVSKKDKRAKKPMKRVAIKTKVKGRKTIKRSKPLKLKIPKNRPKLSVKVTKPRNKDLILILDFGSHEQLLEFYDGLRSTVETHHKKTKGN